MALSQFFVKATPEQTAHAKELSKVTKTNINIKSHSDEQKSNMTINIKLEQPDIILVEHMDNINTKALILNVRMTILNFISIDVFIF